jgi:amidase
MARAGVPVGISFLGTRHSEARLLALAHAFEQAGGTRPRPVLPAIAA